MAVHKVPQDVEADDKFLGPLSFKQFLFFGGFAICGYLSFLTLTKVWPVSFIFIIPMILFAILAVPWSKEQPTELFLASRIRFLIKPRLRIWDQSGVKDLVNITVPIREARVYSDGLSQDQVASRLGALASIVDSRGWAIKNVKTDDSDRLVSAPVVPNEKTAIVESVTDVFDNSNSPIAAQFDNMIEKSEQTHKSETLRLVEQARQNASEHAKQQTDTQNQTRTSSSANESKTGQTNSSTINDNSKPDPSKQQDFWFMHQQTQPTDPKLATFQASTVVTPGADNSTAQQPTNQTATTDISEQELLEAAHKKHERDAMQTVSRHEKVIDPNGTATLPKISNLKSNVSTDNINTMTPPSNPDILNLARSNDLSVETLSRQANKKKDLGDGDEVIISLH